MSPQQKTPTSSIEQGEVVCFGVDRLGALDVPSLSNPILLAAGESHTCAYDDIGLHCWGTFDDSILSPPRAFSSPVSLSVNLSVACMADSLGVECWGQANGGGSYTPPTMSNPLMVGVGEKHYCALDGTEIVCWGDNSRGQLDIPLR